MPRAEAKSSASTASASASPYPSPSASSASSTTSRSSTSSDASSASAAAKKKHVCSQCGRGFTTSGHLARHTRVHTGERNHKCPFPGCETRCSRQDNLQQHYRIHLSPGSRRVSGRALKLKRASQIAQPPMTSPLVLQPATTRSPPPPPNTPPPLEQAPLTALVAESPAASPSSGMLSAGRGHSSSPEGAYPPQYMSASASPATTPSTYGYRTPAYPTSSYDYFSVPAAHHSYVTYAEDCDGRYDVRQAYDPRQVYDDRSWGTGARASSGYDHRASYTDGSSRHSLSYIAPAYRTAEPRRESIPSLASYSGAPSPTSTDSAGSSPTTPAFPYTNNAALVAHGMVAAADDYGKASVSVEQQNVSDYQKAAVAAYPGYAVYDQPSPAYEKHSQTYEQRSPAYDQASPAYDQPSPVYDKPARAYDQPSPAYEEPAASGVAVPDTRAAIVLPPLEGRAPYQPRTTSAAYTQRIEYMNSDRAQYAPSMDRGLPGMDRVLPAMERGLPPLERGMPAMERAAAYEYGRTGYSHPYDMSWKTEGSTRGRLVGAYAQ